MHRWREMAKNAYQTLTVLYVASPYFEPFRPSAIGPKTRSLHRPGGACIIDTPGLRAWQPDADEEELKMSFNDIAALADQCQFRDCRHASEPGCAVRDVVDADRLQNYRKLLREVRRAEQTALERIAERGKWKVLMKEARQRGRDKRGG